MSMIAAYQNDGSVVPTNGGARAAILLIALGAEGASRILKHFSPDDIRRLKESAGGLRSVEPEAIEAIVGAFQDAFKKVPGLDGPGRQMDELLEGALGQDEFNELFAARGASPVKGDLAVSRNVWNEVAALSGEVLAPKLSREHPQIIAILLSKMPADTAALLVNDFEPVIRNAVIRRMLTIKPLAEPVQDLFETHIRDAYLAADETTERDGGSHATLAEIVNRLGKQQSDEIIAALEREKPNEAQALKKLLFAFEDIVDLSQKARLTLFDAIDTETTILALRGAEGDLKESILSALGGRARRMVEAELAQEANIQTSEIDAARRRIASEALRLAGEGRIRLKAPEDEPA